MQVIGFLLGTAIGSFLNVIAVRYNPDKFLLARPAWSGRSRCGHCGAQLRWFELIPLVSFLIQRGRCRRCRTRLSPQYFIAELISGLILLLVPGRLTQDFFLPGMTPLATLGVQAVFVFAFWTLLLIALIDARFEIIPDELNIFLLGLGVAYVFLAGRGFSFGTESFIGHYALLFSGRTNIWLNHLWGALAGGAFLGFLFLVTWGRGMGFGDVKLAFALGFLFGWPDIILLIFASFIVGSLVGLFEVARRRRRLEGFLPFGPFLALGAAILFFCGLGIVNWYFVSFF